MRNILNQIRKTFDATLIDSLRCKNLIFSWRFLFLLYFIFRFLIILKHDVGVDTHIYLDALNRAAHHGNAAAFFAKLGFVYTPFALLLFKPLYFLQNAKFAYIITALISFFCLYLIYEKIIAFFQLHPKEQVIAFVLTLVLADRFISSNINIGQVNLIYFLFILLSFFAILNKKLIKSGFYLCFAMSFKLTPIVFIPYYFVKKQYRTVLFCMIFFIILNLFASVLLGGQDYLKIIVAYFHAIRDTSQVMLFRTDNHSVLTLFFRLFKFYQLPFNLYPKLIWFISFIVTYVSFLFWTYKNHDVHLSYQKKSRCDALDLSLLLTFILIFSPITWGHYLVMLIFPLFFINVVLIKQYEEQKNLIHVFLVYLFFLLNITGTVYLFCNYFLSTKAFLSEFIILNLSTFIYMFWNRYLLFAHIKAHTK